MLRWLAEGSKEEPLSTMVPCLHRCIAPADQPAIYSLDGIKLLLLVDVYNAVSAAPLWGVRRNVGVHASLDCRVADGVLTGNLMISCHMVMHPHVPNMNKRSPHVSPERGPPPEQLVCLLSLQTIPGRCSRYGAGQIRRLR